MDAWLGTASKRPTRPGTVHGDMVRTVNRALAQAVEATTIAEATTAAVVQDRRLLAASLAAATDKAAPLQSSVVALQELLEQERSRASASKLESEAALAAELEQAAALAAAAAASERDRERTARSELQAELDTARRQSAKLDQELWRNAEQLVAAGSRLGERDRQSDVEDGL